jgi:lactoylglutathione lyase
MSIYNHTGQVVADLARSKRFYREVLGFKFWFEFEPPEDAVAKLSSLKLPLGTTACYLTLDGFVLELIHYSAPDAAASFRKRTMNEPGLTHISVAVADVRATAQKAIEFGGQMIEGSDIGIGMMIRDPDGQLVELLNTSYRATLPPKP